MISFTVTALVFGVVFLAELPDKTALAGLVLGTRYRASYVFAGVATAFALHVALAVAAGSVLTLLPQQIVHARIVRSRRPLTSRDPVCKVPLQTGV